MTTSSGVIIRLRSQRATWLFVSLAVGLLGLFSLGIGIGILFADGYGVGERLVLGVGGWLAGMLLLIGAYLGLRVARAVPELRVTSEGLTLHHGGLFRRPLDVSRGEVEEVVVHDALGMRPSGFDVLASSQILPDISTPIPTEARHWNLLIVFRHGFSLGDAPRRGLGAVAFVADRSGAYSGPPRGGVINGLLCEAEDPSEAQRAFDTWGGVLVDQPSERTIARIGAEEARRRMNRRSGSRGHGRH
jgi:hypothetical protein